MFELCNNGFDQDVLLGQSLGLMQLHLGLWGRSLLFFATEELNFYTTMNAKSATSLGS